MDRVIPLEFEIEYRYELNESGILIPVELALAARQVEVTARMDTGASDCLFDQFWAELLGLDVETGYRKTYRTVAGSFVAYGHEVSLRTLGMEWSAMIFFYAASDRMNNFVGRRGWLDRLRLGLAHYDQIVYLSPCEE